MPKGFNITSFIHTYINTHTYIHTYIHSINPVSANTCYWIWNMSNWTLQLNNTIRQYKAHTIYVHNYNISTTGCGRKKSPIWEANKFKTKEDTANVFLLFPGSTQNAVLHQRVLNKTSLKWRPWILIHWCSLEYWYTDVAPLCSCPWPWQSFQV